METPAQMVEAVQAPPRDCSNLVVPAVPEPSRERMAPEEAEADGYGAGGAGGLYGGGGGGGGYPLGPGGAGAQGIIVITYHP